jgi:hypothetical protein
MEKKSLKTATTAKSNAIHSRVDPSTAWCMFWCMLVCVALAV